MKRDDLLHGGRDGRRPAGLEPAAAGPLGGLFTGAAFGGGGPFQGRRPVAGGRELLLGAAQGQPGLHLGGPGQRRRQRQCVAVFRGGLLLGGRLLGRGQPGGHGLQRLLLGRRCSPRPWPATRPAVRFRPRRCAARSSGGPAVRPRPRAGHPIRGASPGRRPRGPAPRPAGPGRRPGRSGSVPAPAVTAASRAAASSTAACTSSSDGALAEPPRDGQGGEDVPCPGHRGQLRLRRRSAAGADSRSSTTAMPASSVLQRLPAAAAPDGRDQVRGPAGTAGQRLAARRGVRAGSCRGASGGLPAAARPGRRRRPSAAAPRRRRLPASRTTTASEALPRAAAMAAS